MLWMDEVLHHLRNPGMMIPRKYPHNFLVSKWCKISSMHSIGIVQCLHEHHYGEQPGPLNLEAVPLSRAPLKTMDRSNWVQTCAHAHSLCLDFCMLRFSRTPAKINHDSAQAPEGRLARLGREKKEAEAKALKAQKDAEAGRWGGAWGWFQRVFFFGIRLGRAEKESGPGEKSRSGVRQISRIALKDACGRIGKPALFLGYMCRRWKSMDGQNPGGR